MGKKSFRKKAPSGNNGQDEKTSSNVGKDQSGNKLVYMFAPMTSDKSTKYATFERTKEKIELRLSKEYDNGNDVAESIAEMAKIDFDAVKPT